jgi:hypothetical protein
LEKPDTRIQSGLKTSGVSKNMVGHYKGYSHDPVMANYKKYGFSGAMAKPYELNELMKIVDQVLGAV